MALSVNLNEELLGVNAPREIPKNYPGWWPSESFLITDNEKPRLFYLRPPTFGLESLPGVDPQKFSFRLGHLELTEPETHARKNSLANYLRSNGLLAMEERVPVLAVGSNASPSQLVHKFRHTGASASIPTIRVSVKNYAVGFVPVVSKHGYVPSTFFPAPGMRTNLFLQFFDRNQLDVMDQSEGVYLNSDESSASGLAKNFGYERLWLDAPINTGSEVLSGAYAYVGRSGVLSLDGVPIFSDNERFGGELSATQYFINEKTSSFPCAYSQQGLANLLGSHDEELGRVFEGLLNRATTQEDAKSELRKKANVRLEHYAQSNELLVASLGSQSSQEPPRHYGDLDQNHDANDLGISSDREKTYGLFRVWPTLDNTEREGESVVVLHKDDFNSLGSPSHVSIHSRPIEDFLQNGHRLDFRAPRAIARCIPDPAGVSDSPSSAVAVKRGCARTDELLRVACGLHRQEIAEIRVIQNKPFLRRIWDKLVDLVLRKPNYVLCRVVLSDITTMEREVALTTPLTIQMLGIDSGDYIVIEGVSRDYNSERASVSSTPARVFELDEQTLEKRIGQEEGGWRSAFPKAQIALGVAQDLPPIFIDSALRKRLFGEGHGQKVGTARVRASRPDQIRRELREFAIVVLFSLIVAILSGESGALDYDAWQLWAFGVILFSTLGLLIMRVRSRYRHTRRSRKWNTVTKRGR